MKNIRVANSPLTNTIYAGTVGVKQMWGKNKTDVTMDVLLAVVSHGLTFGQPILISSADGNPEFKIEVTDLRDKAQETHE